MRTLGEFKIGKAQRVVRLLHSAAFMVAITLLLSSLAQLHSQNASALISTQVPARILSRVDNSDLTPIRGSTHPAVRNAIDNGRLSPAEPMGDLILVLQRSDAQQAALESLNAQQYDPNSPEFHHWLTPTEFGANYGVAASDLNAVSYWLQSQGFIIEEIPPSRTSIRFSGNAGQVEQAFHTEMHSVDYKGVRHVANTTDIQIPTALTSVVVGVKALHNFFPAALHHTAASLSRSSLGAVLPAGLQNSGGQPVGAHSNYAPGDGYQLLVPFDMATIYNYKSLWTAATPINGTGQTIALAGTSNIVLSDVATFRAATGLPANVPKVIVTNSDPGTTNLLDDRFENTLDVEWSGAAAPGASIVLVTSSQTSQTTDALYASESYIINNNVAKIMSVSYGECELGMGTAGNQEYLNLWQQAYTQGIAVFVSSGDSMAAVCDDGNYNPSADYAAQYGLTVSGMTSTPYNISVGGTDFNSTSASWSGTNNTTNMSNATGYIPEVPWNQTVTNPIVLSSLNQEFGINDSAEGMTNHLLKNYGISNGLYDELIPSVGGSGGVSNCTTSSNGNPSSCGGGYAKPAWQAGVTGILTTDKRTVPDVSFFASSGFLGVAYLICDSQPPGYSSPIACSYPANALDMAVGGTSVSSPLMAGVMALINQKAGGAQGNPNAVLYGLAAKQNYSNCSAETVTNSSACYFNDINTGTIAAPCFVGDVNCTAQTAGDVLGILPGYAATTGYDKATGLGSLNVANVVNGWPGVASAPSVSLSPSGLTFASTVVGSSAAAQTVTLTNSGTASMTISGISITGSYASSFSETNNCAATLAVNASCTVTVTFKPATTGALAASVSLADNAPNSPQTVALSGTGLAANTPVASLSSTSLVFAPTTIGTSSATQAVSLTNSGTGAMTISGIGITGTNASSFSETNNCAATLAANALCTVTVTFKPAATGTLVAAVSFANNATNSPQTVSLSGTGAAPVTIAATVSPTSLTFPSTAIGSASASQTVTFTNTGTAPLTFTSSPTITGANGSLFHGASSCGGNATLAVGASCLTTFTFNPTAAGTFTATLSFNDNVPNSPQTLLLTGIGGGTPAVTLSPTSLSFASTNIGSASAAQIVTLKNTGTGALTISSVSFTGTSAASYAQTNTCGTSLAASASCTISVTFNPTAVGAAPASLSIADNATSSSQIVSLTGTGVGVPVVSLSPTSLSFASTYVGSASAAQIVTLKNTGTAALTITGVSISGASAASYAQTNTCGTSLSSSASCAITVTFKPAAAGTLTALLTLTDNATTSGQGVALSGTGVIPLPTVTLSTTSLSFPVTVVNASTGYAYSPAQTITLTNTGAAALSLTSIALGGTNPTSFSQMNNCPSSLAISASCTILARFAPTASGTRSATLVFSDNANPTTQTVSLSGTGVSAAMLTLSSSALSFGTVTSGTASAAQTITVSNSSTTTPVNLTSIALSGAGAASFVQVSNCGTMLPASSSCIIMVEFVPATASAATATLTVTANNPNASATVALTGTGH